MRERELDGVAGRYPYYRGRSGYMLVAARLAGELIESHGLRSALEIGPHLRPVVVGADVMELVAKPDSEAEGRLIVHDARRTPWPIADRTYDLVVALQVFEHLGAFQAAAFREVRRVAWHAIISVPIDWEMADPTNCHHHIFPRAGAVVVRPRHTHPSGRGLAGATEAVGLRVREPRPTRRVTALALSCSGRWPGLPLIWQYARGRGQGD